MSSLCQTGMECLASLAVALALTSGSSLKYQTMLLQRHQQQSPQQLSTQDLSTTHDQHEHHSACRRSGPTSLSLPCSSAHWVGLPGGLRTACFFIASQSTASRLRLKHRDEPTPRTSPQGTVHLHQSLNGTVAVDYFYELSNKEPAVIM